MHLKQNFLKTEAVIKEICLSSKRTKNLSLKMIPLLKKIIIALLSTSRYLLRNDHGCCQLKRIRMLNKLKIMIEIG